MEIAQLSFSEKMYWLAKYRNDLIEKIKDSEKDQKEKEEFYGIQQLLQNENSKAKAYGS